MKHPIADSRRWLILILGIMVGKSGNIDTFLERSFQLELRKWMSALMPMRAQS